MNKEFSLKLFLNRTTLYAIIGLLIYSVLLINNISVIRTFIGDEKTYVSSTMSLLNGSVDMNNHPLFAKTIWYSIVYFFYAIFGTDNPLFWRIGTILFSIGILIIFFKIAREFFSRFVSYIAVILLAFDPMFFSFSRLVHLDIPALFFTLLCFYFFIQFIKKPKQHFLNKTGVCLGLSLACKLSSLMLVPLLSFFVIFLLYKQKSIKNILRSVVFYFLFFILGFVIGNSIFFFKHSDYNFLSYTFALFESQLHVPISHDGFLTSPAWSWFSVPQILTLYRTFPLSKNSVITVVAFQNPLLFATTIVAVIFNIILLLRRNKMKQKKFILATLLFFFGLYIPLFSPVHQTYYYYIIPFIPLSILLLLFLLQQVKWRNQILVGITVVSIFIFLFSYPMLIGKPVSFSYEKALFRYSLYRFPNKSDAFCIMCSPREYPKNIGK